MYKDKRTDVVIARLEGSLNEEISRKYGIYSFPMVTLFHPGDLHVRALFQNQRIASVMAQWIDQNAPKLTQEENKIPNVVNVKNLDDNIIIVKANKTEVTDELEFVKREIITLKNKIEKLENEIQLYKNQTENNSVGSIFKDNQFKTPNLFQMITFFAVFLVFIAACLTIKRLFSGKKAVTGSDNSHHAKV
jgi:hypothetical protein